MQIIEGNILKVKYGIICQQVNCKGKMGAGIALAIRKMWPVVYKDYIESYKTGNLKLGAVIVTTIIPHNLFVANLCGQYNYGRKGRYTNYQAIETCLKYIDSINSTGLPIYIPYGMGCTLAGGNWNIVSNIIEKIIPNAIIVKYDRPK